MENQKFTWSDLSYTLHRHVIMYTLHHFQSSYVLNISPFMTPFKMNHTLNVLMTMPNSNNTLRQDHVV